MKKMNKDKIKMTERILNHALEIIYLLTGEEYTIVKRSSPHRSLQQLTGEVPIKCDDVAVYFSLEEWEYIEGHRELYKEVMMEEQQTPRTLGTPAHARSETKDGIPDPVLVSEEAEDESDENDIQLVETHPEPDTDSSCDMDTAELLTTWQGPAVLRRDVIAGVVINIEQTEALCVRNEKTPEQELCDSIGTGDNKPETASVDNIEDHLEYPDKELPDDTDAVADFQYCAGPKTVGSSSWMDSASYYSHFESASYSQSFDGAQNIGSATPDCVIEDINVLQTYPARLYYCSECQECFTCNSDLVKHRAVHKGGKVLTCSTCGKHFSFKSKLVRHQRIHTGERPFVCTECGKSFGQKSQLIIHYRGHTGEKPYVCSECGKGFGRKSYLVNHQRIHRGEKPFACFECGKMFGQKSQLILHQRSHTGEKPFICSDCGKSFSCNSNLVTHQRTHGRHREFLNIVNMEPM